MRIDVQGIGKGRAASPLLPELSCVLTADAPAVVTVGTERGPMLASLIVGGRLRPDRGRVLLDGSDDAAALRTSVALVDTPMVAEPDPDVRVGDVVREQLLYARRPTSAAEVARTLDELDLAQWRRTPIAALPPGDRLALLLSLAAIRPTVRAIVLTSPERHGGTSAEWLGLARTFTEHGTPVLVIAGRSADALVTPASAEQPTEAGDAAQPRSESVA